jgi:hypothetical protein
VTAPRRACRPRADHQDGRGNLERSSQFSLAGLAGAAARPSRALFRSRRATRNARFPSQISQIGPAVQVRRPRALNRSTKRRPQACVVAMTRRRHLNLIPAHQRLEDLGQHLREIIAEALETTATAMPLDYNDALGWTRTLQQACRDAEVTAEAIVVTLRRMREAQLRD